MNGNTHRVSLLILIVLLMITAGSICRADITSDTQLLRTSLKDQQRESALTQLKTLITNYPKDAASFITDDQNKKLWDSKLSDATSVLKQIAESSPRNATGLLFRIALLDCYKNQKDWDKAFPLLEAINTDYPDQQCTYHNLKAICYYNQGKDYDASLNEAKQAAGLYAGPSDEKTLINTVLSCYSSNKTVIRAAYVIVRYSPGSTDLKKADLFKWAGQLCSNAGHPAEAIQVLKKAMQLCGSQDAAKKRSIIANIMDCYKAMGADKDAAAFEDAMGKEDSESIAICQQQRLMHVYLDRKRYEDAITICKDVLKRATDSIAVTDALTVMAECLYPLGRGNESAKLQDEYFASHPKQEMTAALVKAKTIYYAERNFTKADEVMKKFIQDYPNSPSVSNIKELLASNMLSHMNNPSGAREIYNDLISSGSDSADIRFNLAYCSYYEKDYKAAKESFKYVYDNFTNTKYAAPALYMIGDCCTYLGDKESAKTSFENVLQNYPAAGVAADVPRRLAELQKPGKEKK